ncbi:MurR/RpiR family transcriptional regulator [Lachnospiraceae bacterium 62-26]
MLSKNELWKKIEDGYPKFSKGQRKLADFIQKDYDKAAFLTAARMGEEVGVSESTVVRFAMALGYEGYPGFQKALGEMVRTKLNSIQRMEVTYGRISQGEILATVLHSDIEKIKLTMEAIDHETFEMAVDTILNARKIFVVGIRSCAPLASFLSFYLNLVCDNVIAVNTNSPSEIFEQMLRINEEDAIIGISFPRYSMRTLKALEYASNRKAKVITLTDSVHSPMTLYSSCNLIARSDMASIVDSLVAPLSVVNALVVALCMKKQKEVITTLETLEEIWDEYQVYNKDELNMVGEKMELSGARGEAEDAQTEVFGAQEETEGAQTEVSGARGDAGSLTQGTQKE